MPDSLASRYEHITEQIRAACVGANRSPEEVTTIVVTKFHSSSVVRELHALGVRHVGENRHQEAVAKHAELVDLDLTWHFVGQLQSNKAKAVAQYCVAVHSVDRSSLVTSLAQSEQVIDVFLEVNLTDVPGRGGAEPDDIAALAERVLESENLRLRGLMAVAPLGESAHEAFERVHALAQELLSIAPDATDLSLGMSGDFAEAIGLGATHLRIGTAITGKRPSAT
jgi:pyridoxal phosphate enzyme (YggS family)